MAGVRKTVSNYVMFGFSPLFGDYADLVHALGGRIRCVVQNIPDPTPEGKPTLSDRLERYRQWLARNGGNDDVPLVWLDDFEPRSGDLNFLGFRGQHQRALLEELKARYGITPATLVHPTAHVSMMTEVGAGTIVAAGAVIAAGTTIGQHALVNRSASIGHDCQIASFTNIGPGSRMASSVKMEEGAVVGVGATIIEERVIGRSAYVAGGATVIRDVAPDTLVAGVPAVLKKDLSRGKRT